jgi:hypothetical protein
MFLDSLKIQELLDAGLIPLDLPTIISSSASFSFLYTYVKLKEKNAKALLYGFILKIQVDVFTNVV